jgi:hypothetical protein
MTRWKPIVLIALGAALILATVIAGCFPVSDETWTHTRMFFSVGAGLGIGVGGAMIAIGVAWIMKAPRAASC